MCKSADEQQYFSETAARSCRLCSALRNEIEKAHTNGESEREKLLNMLLNGHLGACHS
jgi:hypothetical protein